MILACHPDLAATIACQPIQGFERDQACPKKLDFPGEKNAARREAALTALKELQDQLGALNDLAQREALAANGHDLGEHAHGLLTPKAADVDQLLDRAQKAHADFAKVKSFWK